MSPIFISYSRKDSKVTDRIANALLVKREKIWIDRSNQLAGVAFENQIFDAVRKAQAFLFVVSENSANNQMCQREIKEALAHNKRIIPVRIDGIDPEELLPSIRPLHFVDCREGVDDFDGAIDEIYESIHKEYEWLIFHTQLEDKALAWKRNQQDNSRLLRGKELQEAEQQLAGEGSTRDPQPTSLQRSYVLASRRDDVRKRKQTNIGLTTGFILISIFCFVAVAASIVAVGQRNQAVSKENARATAQANAEEQANIALARQLAAQAQLLFNNRDSSPLVATLLAIESKQRFPNSEADGVIRNSLDLLLPLNTQIPTSHSKEITSVAFSPDGNFIASGSSDNTARIWDSNSGDEINHFQISGQVTYVRFSPDSKLLYVKSEDGYIRSWDIKRGAQILEAYHGEGNPVFDLSADGRIAVSSGTDGIVLIGDTETGREIAEANHNKNNPVKFVAISPDGTRVASVGGEDTIVKVWDSQNGRLISQKSTDTTPWAVAFSPDTQKIISNSGPNSELWDVETGELVTKINTNSVGKYLFSPNGQFIATLSVNAKKVEIWNAETGELVTSLPHEFFVFSMAFSPDGKYLASGSADGVIKLWNPVTGKEIGRIIKSGTVDFAFSPKSDVIASPTDNTVYIWHISRPEVKFKLPSDGDKLNTRIDPTGEWIASWNQNGNAVNISDIPSNTVRAQVKNKYPLTTLSFSPDGSMLITGTENGNICIWKVPTGEKTNCFFRESRVNVVAISPDLKFAATAQSPGLSTENYLTIWNIQTGEKVFETNLGFFIEYITFSPDNEMVAVGGFQTYISLWDINTQKEISRFERYETMMKGAEAMVFSSNGKWLVTSGGDAARVWDLSKLEEISRIAYDHNEFYNLWSVLKTVFNPDQTKLASVNTVALWNLTLDADTKREATILIWDPLSGKEIVRMVHNSWVNDIVWSPDGKFVLSGGWDGVLRIWDVSNGNEVGAIIHDSPITQLQFAPNGEQIISISDNGIYKISYLGQGDIILQECSPVTRNLSLSEWIQYFGNIEYHATCPNLPVPTQ